MGKILFETSSATYEIEKSDQEVLERFGEITGIKVKVKPSIQTCLPSQVSESPIEGKPFNSETIPDKAEIIEYIENHLSGYNTSMVLEHFFGHVPKYGVSDEQDRLIGMLNARINRSRKVVEQERRGVFELTSTGPAKLYVFRQLNENEQLSEISTDEDNQDMQEGE